MERNKRKKILIVEDEMEFADFLRIRLEYNNFEVHEAYDGEEGLTLSKKLIPDLIVLNLIMPKMTGFAVCREIRKNPMTETTPIIILTSMTGENVRKEALKAGVDLFIAKPLDPEFLMTKVNDLLNEVIKNKDQSFDRR